MPAVTVKPRMSIVDALRGRFGDRMRYVFRHRPIIGSEEAEQAAELAEYASQTTGKFWTVHDVLMKRGLRSMTVTWSGSHRRPMCRRAMRGIRR